MNRIFRVIWSHALKQRVVASELCRSPAGLAVGGSAGSIGAAPLALGSLYSHLLHAIASRTGRLALSMLLGGVALAGAGSAHAQAMPSGALLAIDNGSNPNSATNTASTWQLYTLAFTPTTSGNNFLLFAFRQVPAYWTFGNVSLSVAGDSTNLLVDPTFAQGGSVSGTAQQAPASWGIVYQTGTTPSAAGAWQAPASTGQPSSSVGQGVNTATSGAWYDGAVESYDGIYQGVDLTAGVTYTISFSAYTTNTASTSTATGIALGVFAGTCVSLSGPVGDCAPSLSSGFTSQYLPSQTVDAGAPPDTTVGPGTPTPSSGAAANVIFDGGTLVDDGGTLDGHNYTITGNNGTIDMGGNNGSISTAIGDDTSGVPGNLTLINGDPGTGGTLDLSGVNTYTGSTSIGQGTTIALTGNGSIAASSGVTDNGTLDISGASGNSSIQSLAGNGNVALGGNSLDITNASDTFSGVIDGQGGVIVSGGTEILGGANTYLGGTTVQGGATVVVANDGNLGDASGALNLDNGTLQTTGNVDSTRNIVVTGTGTVDTGASTEMSTQGTVTGTGGLIKDGAGTLDIEGVASQTGGTTVLDGTLVLGGINTYIGGNLVQGGGTLQIANDGNLGDASNNIELNGGTLHTTGDVDTGRNIIVDAGNGALNIDLGTTTTSQGTVSGAGGLIKDGAGTLDIEGDASQAGGTTVLDGTLILGGANTYTGGNVVQNGTLQIANDNNLGDASNNIELNGGTLHTTGDVDTSRNIIVDAGNGALNIDLGTTTTSQGTVSGAGGLIKDGDGTLDIEGVASQAGGTTVNDGTLILGGANTYTGGNLVQGGVLQIANDGNLGDTSNGIELNGGTLHTTGDVDTGRNIIVDAGNGALNIDLGTTTTSQGTVSGAGGLIKDGAGTLDLEGVASQAGGTTVNDGTLILGGANTYTGGNLVQGGGTLQIANDGNLGDTSNGIELNGGTLHTTGNVDTSRNIVVDAGNGALNTDAGTTTTSQGTVSGAGGLIKDGDGTLDIEGIASQAGGTTVLGGTLILGGANTYTGGNVVQNGVLQISNDGNLGDASNNIELNFGVLHTTGNVDTSRNIVVDAGYGGIVTDAGTVMISQGTVNGVGGLIKAGDGTLDLEGVASQAGGTMVFGGTLILGGANTYTGGNVVQNGTLQIANDGNLGDASNNIDLNGGTLHTTGNVDTNRNIVIDAGSSAVNTDAGTTMTSQGTVSGAGGLVKNGDGTLDLEGVASHSGGTTVNDGILILGGNNTYTGGTVVNSTGTLQIANDDNLGDASSNVALDGGTLHTTGNVDTSRNITLAGSGFVNTDTGTTTISQGTVSGAGGLIKDGNGTLDLEGVASHAGGTTVNDGILILGGANTYTGGNTLNGGTLQVSSDANLGDASNNVTFHGGNLDITQTMTSNRQMVLGIEGGTLTTDSGAILYETGNIVGNGGLIKQGGGTLVVSGANTFSGGTLIDGGVVQIDNGSSLGTGAIVLNGGQLYTIATLGSGQQVVVSGNSGVYTDAATTTTLSGDIVTAGSAGCFVKSGKGTLNLTGRASLANGTCVEDGMLRVNGSLTSFVVVDQPGTLRGTGVINGTVNVSGTLAPGDSPGTLITTGTVTMNPGSTLEIDIDGTGTGNGAGNYSRLLVTGANSQFLAAGTLQPKLRGITGDATNTFVPSLGDTYRVVTADGGIVGRFSALAQPDGLAANTRFEAFYNILGNNSIDLRIAPDSYAAYVTAANANGNTRRVGSALDAVMDLQDNGTATATQSELLYAVAGLTSDQLAHAAKSLSGEVHADLAAASRASGIGLDNQVADHMESGNVADSDVSNGHVVWANTTRLGDRSTSDSQASGFQSGGNQVTAGVDIYRSDDAWIGVGVSHADTSLFGVDGSASIMSNSGFVYGQHTLGRLLVDGLASYGSDRWNTRRSDALGAGSLSGNADGHEALASVGLRLPIQMQGQTLEPFTRVTWQRNRREGFNEDGSSISALQVQSFNDSGARALAGVTLGTSHQDPFSTPVTYQVGAGVGVDTGSLLNPSVRSTFVGQSVDAQSPNVGRAFVQLNVSGTMALGKQTYLYAGITSETGHERSAYGATAGIRVAF